MSVSMGTREARLSMVVTKHLPITVELLITKATVDADFRQLLLETRDAAAETIGLHLDPAEVLMLKAAPREQLAAIIERTNVPTEHRRAFLGTAAAAMLAAISVMTHGCTGSRPDDRSTEGIRPDTVAISYHYGQESPGFPAFARKGIAVNHVLESHPDKVSGMNSFNDTKCNVYRV